MCHLCLINFIEICRIRKILAIKISLFKDHDLKWSDIFKRDIFKISRSAGLEPATFTLVRRAALPTELRALSLSNLLMDLFPQDISHPFTSDSYGWP